MATSTFSPVTSESNRLVELCDRIDIAQDTIRHAQHDLGDAQRKIVIELARRGNFEALKPDMRFVRQLVSRDERHA